MPIAPLPILGGYERQRFRQFSPEDCANWTLISDDSGKKKAAMYPTMGRSHVEFGGRNRLNFNDEPRAIYRSINYWYVIIDDSVFRIDNQYNVVNITVSDKLATLNGNVFFDYIVAGNITFAAFVDGQNVYIYREPDSVLPGGQFYIVTDPKAPSNPSFIATFGNRLVVSDTGSSQFNLSTVLLDGNSFDATTCFTIASSAVFAQEEGIIRQFAVLNNTLYIFTDFNVGIWSNITSQLVPAGGESAVTFPWKKSNTYSWNFGIADPKSLSVGFNMMAWLAKNKDGLIQFMVSNGGAPQKISNKAIDVLIQKYSNSVTLSSQTLNVFSCFLYQYENTIFYRVAAGRYLDECLLNQQQEGNSVEFNFDTKKWTRCIEVNGERNRIQQHVFFNNKHFVTVYGEKTIYEMSGRFYTNEITNPDADNIQAENAYSVIPFRYERVTPIISQDDYSEFVTDYVQIDFVFGKETDYIDEVDVDVFNPHVELYFSDDGGISFVPADSREFSKLGVYRWRMRWYQLGASRNRVYKLISVSEAPIVILGGVMDVRRVSGGAN